MKILYPLGKILSIKETIPSLTAGIEFGYLVRGVMPADS